MLYNHFTEELLGLQGVKITNVEQEENLIIHLEMERKKDIIVSVAVPQQIQYTITDCKK